ncbi:MAG TPA: alpha-L-arabinofuranosidase C-terminal domain-containing protein [Ilumatobacter sp.]|nr:alpha-L-arabinofuranosidase C-terminal domain-containing protein [Ilumatobacter sp.]
MSTQHAEVAVGHRATGEVSKYLFGALTEHFGYGLYGGVWDTTGDAPRADVAGAVRGLGTTMLRYPGGCFSDWYHWRDGIGPRHARPTYESTYWTEFEFPVEMPDPAGFRRQTGPVETNAVGTDEFLQYCVDVGVEPMLAVNFGSGTPDEAAAWVAHTNRRAASPSPVRWWCVGNETYGPWEIGHCTPEEYARGFGEYAQAMRAVDPDIGLVAVGALEPAATPRADWNATVLADVGEHADALSVHWYFPGPFRGRPLRDDEPDFRRLAAAPDHLGELLDGVIAEVDHAVGAARRMPLALDEWNMWDRIDDLLHTNRRLCDAVFFGGCYNRMIERADRVRFAMVSHLVNCMAPIQTEGDRHYVTSAYLVGALYARHRRHSAVPVTVRCATFTADAFVEPGAEATTLTASAGPPGRVSPLIDAAATADETGVTLFLINRSIDEPCLIDVSGTPAGTGGILRTVAGPGPFASNDVDHPFVLGYRETVVRATGGGCRVELPPHTVGALVLDA